MSCQVGAHRTTLEVLTACVCVRVCSVQFVLVVTMHGLVSYSLVFSVQTPHWKAFQSNIFHTQKSSREGATRLKFVPFCSPRDALSDDIKFCQNRFGQFRDENHGVVSIKFHNSLLEGSIKLKLALFCSP